MCGGLKGFSYVGMLNLDADMKGKYIYSVTQTAQYSGGC